MQFKFSSIDHMTHIKNLDSIFSCGKLLAHNNRFKKVDISNQEVNSRRVKNEPIYGRSVHEYVPFYFNPRNAMMYKNKDKDIVILAFDAKLIQQNNVLFTNKNASANSVQFYNDLKDLNKLNWQAIQSESWYNDYNKKQLMMAEVLVYKEVSLRWLKGIYCKNEATKAFLIERYGLKKDQIKIVPKLFFQEYYTNQKSA